MNALYKPTEAQKALRRVISANNRVLVYGGSRSGKTFELCRTIAVLAMRYGGRYAIFRRYFNAVRSSVFCDTFPKMMRLCFPQYEYKVNKSLCEIYFPLSGAEIDFVGLDDDVRVEKILGREFATIYFNECSEISYSSVEVASTRLAQKCYDLQSGALLRNRMLFDCNPPGKSHWSYKLFIEGVNPLTRVKLPSKNGYGVIQINPRDNVENLPAEYITNVLESGSERSKRRFLYGEFSDENENALWKSSSMIDPFRVTEAPIDLERIVVGVDPAATSNENSDHTGIVVCGSKTQTDGIEHYYVLSDRSVIASPTEWARRVAETFDAWKADVVVAEINQGGDMVETTLRQAAPNLPVVKVRATRGKIVRAEPISVIYTQGRVHHVGLFEDLENELTSYTGEKAGEDSPDRMDALVWAMTELTNGRNYGEADGGNLYWS